MARPRPSSSHFSLTCTRASTPPRSECNVHPAEHATRSNRRTGTSRPRTKAERNGRTPNRSIFAHGHATNSTHDYGQQDRTKEPLPPCSKTNGQRRTLRIATPVVRSLRGVDREGVAWYALSRLRPQQFTRSGLRLQPSSSSRLASSRHWCLQVGVGEIQARERELVMTHLPRSLD
ncbi:hypothetical protein BC629DRAFT_1600864 [Irpex lacteus]|nr:hypothetical protein BC629DRAFT_1600864 [Irpex lacteus]